MSDPFDSSWRGLVLQIQNETGLPDDSFATTASGSLLVEDGHMAKMSAHDKNRIATIAADRGYAVIERNGAMVIKRSSERYSV